MTPCVKCKKEASFQLMEWYCNKCFCKVIESRIKKSLRKTPICKSEHIIVLGELAHYCLNKAIQGLPVVITTVATEKELEAALSSNPDARVVIPWTMDMETGIFLSEFLRGRISAQSDEKTIKLFLTITAQELKKYAELNEFSSPLLPNEPMQDALNKIEEKYPSTKYSLLKSANALRSIMQNANVKKIAIKEEADGYPTEH